MTSRFVTALACLAALVCLAGHELSASQGPPNQQEPPNQQAFGPPDGQFGPPGQGRGGFGPRLPLGLEPVTGWLLIPEVGDELQLKPEQRENIQELQREWESMAQSLMGSLGPPGDFGGGDDPFAVIRGELEKFNAKADKRLAELFNETQRARLVELRLQREGYQAFQQKSVQEKLALTPEQVTAIGELGPPDGFGPPPGPEATQQVLALLNEKQRATWTELTGAPFEFPQDRGFGRGGRGGRGFGGRGGPGGEDRKILAQYDANHDGWLNKEERDAARAAMGNTGGDFGGRRGGRGRGGDFGGDFGGPGGFGGRGGQPGTPGPHLTPEEVTPVPDAELYEATALRTLFLNFEGSDWEEELEVFHNTDVEVPATLIVDGTTYSNVGVHFRGMSSYMGVSRGSKRSLDVSLDFVDEDQRLYGYKTLNLLNAHADPSFLSSVLYSHIARQYIPAPKANLVKVVINGESWGIYANVQQYDKVFIEENFDSKQGTRWKVQGSPGGRGGLEYLGEDLAPYQQIYSMKSDDGEEAWRRLVELCKVLNQTPPDELEQALEPILHVDEALWFLALDTSLVNSDGFWTRASDYYLFLDESGRFSIIPHDMNEAFHGAGGRGGGPGGRGGRGGGDRGGDFQGRDFQGRGRGGFPGGELLQPQDFAQDQLRGQDQGRGQGQDRGQGPPQGFGGQGRGRGGRGGRSGFGGGGGGATLDPLVGLEDTSKALRGRLLAVPALRERYLEHVRTIAEKSLDWQQIGPVIKQYAELIDAEVKADTRKLSTYEEFVAAVSDETPAASDAPRRGSSLKSFFEQRRRYLLDYRESAPPTAR